MDRFNSDLSDLNNVIDLTHEIIDGDIDATISIKNFKIRAVDDNIVTSFQVVFTYNGREYITPTFSGRSKVGNLSLVIDDYNEGTEDDCEFLEDNLVSKLANM